MLLIDYKDSFDLYWSDEELQWTCSEEAIEEIFNATLPEFHVSDPLRTGGLQRLALKAAQKIFGSDIKVLKETPPPVIKQEPGSVI